MHTTKDLRYSEFTFNVEGKKALLEDIFPDFHENDRIGIVVSEDGGTIGASALIMSAITRFYDFYRGSLGKGPGEYWIYPEFFVFNVSKQRMNHAPMDIWPPHKEVTVEDDPEQILEAINDRSITRLVVEDREPVEGTFLLETLTSANSRIVSAVAYSPTGRVQRGNIEIQSCQPAEDYVHTALGKSDMLDEDVRTRLKKQREDLQTGSDGNIVETYRFIDPKEAIKMLTSNTQPGEATQAYRLIAL